MFENGAKVVCINDQNFVSVECLVEFPKKGVVYTVRDCVGGTNDGGKTETVAVYLKEIVNPPSLASGQEMGFNWNRFREVEEDTDEAEEKEEVALFITHPAIVEPIGTLTEEPLFPTDV